MAFPGIDADCVGIYTSASVKGRTQPLTFGRLNYCGVSYLQGCSLNQVVMIKICTMATRLRQVHDVKNRSYSALKK